MHSLREMVLGATWRSTAGPSSPSFSDVTHASAMNFGVFGPKKIITRSNLKSNTQALEDLVDTCANYRAALATMSRATAAFADAMERCGGLKGPSYEACTRLQASSGIHYLMGNQWHVLGETLDKKFEKPLRQHLEAYRTTVTERSTAYERAIREKSQIIHDTEAINLNKKERNLQTFREALAVLQRQVDELDNLKAAHYRKIVDHEEEVWDVVQGKLCIVVRSTMDVFDRFTAKALDPIIEPMLQCVPDPFDSYGPPQPEDQIFSILAPLSIMTNPQPSPTATPKSVSNQPLPAPSTSVSGSNAVMPEELADWAHMPSSDVTLSSPTSTEQLSVSPVLSPQPTYQSVRPAIDRPHQNPRNSSTSEDSRADDALAQATHSFGQEWAFTNGSRFEDTMHDGATARHFDSRPSTPSRPNADTHPTVVMNQPPHG